MIVSINQPAYLPWLGYFERIDSSDIHIILDHVQFEKNSMINRNKVRTAQGWTWLTVPVLSKGKFGNLHINELKVSENTKWQKKHWNTIRGSYSKSPFFKEHAMFFEALYEKKWVNLNLLMTEITNYILQELSITSKIIRSSEMDLKYKKSELVFELCNKVGATTYLSGAMGRDYLEIKQFQEHNINVKFQDYNHPIYRQMHGEFQSYMSIIDLLFNEGKRSLDVLTRRVNK